MRIVSLAPSNTEIIYKLGAEHKIIGTTSLCDHPAQARQKPSVGGWSKGIDFEKITEMDPDMVLASDDLQNQAVDQLRDKGHKVVQFQPHTLEEVFESIENIGKLLGQMDKAEAVLEEMRARIGQIDLEGKRIYCEEWMDPPMISGNWIPELIQRVNGKYMMETGQRSRKIGAGEIKEFNPEHIILNVCGAGENLQKQQIMQREEWQNIKAVKDQNIHIVHDALLNRPGPRLVEGAEKISEAVSNQLD